MSDVYNSGTVPHGGAIVAILRGSAVAVVTCNLESFTPNYPTVSVDRPGADGAADDWVVVAGQATATGVLQVPNATDAADPAKAIALGDYFNSADGFTASAPEKWVITDISQPRAMGDYYKANVTFKKDNA